MDYALSSKGMLKAQWRTIVALLLHDVRTRAGGNAFGFVAMGVFWPLSHILILLFINAVLGRAAPYGVSAALWYATGVVPFMAFQYTSRWIMMGVFTNRQLLTFPIVKITDVLVERALVEVLNTGLVVLIIFAIFSVLGIEFLPLDIPQASLAMLAMILLGLAWGVVNAIIAGAFPLWLTGFFIFQMILWIASGIVIVPDALPRQVQIPLSYLPTLQGVEWMRSAYYEGYGASILDKTYLIVFGIVTLFIGLMLERLVRGKLLQ